jgi:hypothetical protein
LTGDACFRHNGGELKTRMPLEFESLSHGKIAFGFFNIETDMILLNQYFLSAKDFCQYIAEASQKNEPILKTSWEVYSFQNRGDIGNLMGAIHGSDYRGFIGEVYKLFPFPKHRDDFKQKSEGFKNRSLIKSIIQKYVSKVSIIFEIDQKSEQIAIGEYLFNKNSFHQLIQYVLMGGFPRWKDEIRPDYVFSMARTIAHPENLIFDSLILI